MDLPVDYTALEWWERKAVRLAYVERQGGKCHHCGESLDGPSADKRPVKKRLFPPSFFAHPVHLHHSHDTGLTIGAVHNHCNAVLWQYHGE